MLISCELVSRFPTLDTENLFMDLCNGRIETPASVTFEKFVGMDSGS